MLRRLPTLLAALTCLALLCGPTSAMAQSTWPSQRDICGGYDDAEFGSGQMDAAGRLYLPCSESVHPTTGALRYDNHIGIFNHAGEKIDRVGLSFDRNGYNYRATAVAPSPDGSVLYAIRRGDLRVYRFVRQADGGYVANSQAEWRLQNFTNYDGRNTPAVGVFLTTDGGGNIYMSVGRWCGLVIANCDIKGTIVKFAPDGRFITRVGTQYGGTGAGDSRQGFGGLTVTADGTRLFATDPLNSRIHRFDRAGNGTYAPARVIESSYREDGVPTPACFADGRLAAPYDVTLTAGGELVAINTTCNNANGRYGGHPWERIELQRFTQDGAIRGSVLSTSHRPLSRCDADPNCGRVHGIAVGRNGRVQVVQALASIMPVGWADMNDVPPVGGAAPLDTAAPVVATLAAPATTTIRTIGITLAAADARGATEMELVRDGISYGWTPYSTSFGLTLPDRLGAHVITIRVRDAAGNTSAARAVTVNRVAQAAGGGGATTPPPAGNNTNQSVVSGGGGAAPAETKKPAKSTKKPAKKPAKTKKKTGPTPVITRVSIPVQVFRGRSARVTIRARGGAHQVRFSTSRGRWGKWRSIKDGKRLVLPKGAGWKPVFTQVRNRSGKRSKIWFQPVFVAKRGTYWKKGTSRTDRLNGTRRRATHIDSSTFDFKADRITCRNRHDTVLAQPEDKVSRSCRKVIRVKMPRR